MTNLDSGSATAGKAVLLLVSNGFGYILLTGKQKKTGSFTEKPSILYEFWSL